jgi:hypothetical protein
MKDMILKRRFEKDENIQRAVEAANRVLEEEE